MLPSFDRKEDPAIRVLMLPKDANAPEKIFSGVILIVTEARGVLVAADEQGGSAPVRRSPE